MKRFFSSNMNSLHQEIISSQIENNESLQKHLIDGVAPVCSVLLKQASNNLINNLKENVIGVDTNGRVLFLNNTAQEFLNRDKSKIVGELLYDLINIEYQLEQNKVFDIKEKIIDSEKYRVKQRYENLLCDNKKNNTIEISLNIIPLSEKSKLIGVLFIIYDETLQNLVANELIKIQQLESQKEFIGGIAHDFNNILTSVIGHISLAQLDSSLDDTMKERLVAAEKNCDKARNLTFQLMNYSKEGSPSKKCGSLLEVVEETAKFVSHGTNIELEFKFDDNVDTVDFDTVQISQIVNNLVLNAIQAMPYGGKVEIIAKNTKIKKTNQNNEETNDYVSLEIIDNGVGISKENIERIFDPLFTTKSTGNGFGLASCKKIIQNHNGTLNVKSELGVGTKFQILLPSSKKIMTDKVPTKTPQQHKSDGRILLLDDDQEVRNILEAMLELLGFDVDLAANETEALKLCRNAKDSNNLYKYALIDLTIKGGGSGIDVLAKFKEIDNNLKAILTTGYLNNELTENYERYGFIGFLPKPFRIQDLSSLFEEIESKS